MQLRVAFISPFQLRLRRGIERSVLNLASQFAVLGQKAAIFSWGGEIPRDEILQENVQLYSMPQLRYFESRWASLFYAGFLVHFKPDVVVVYFAGYGEAMSLALMKPILKPTVAFIVGYPFDLVPHRFSEFQSAGLGGSLAAILVKSKHMVAQVEAFFQRDVRVIPNGVDTKLFHPGASTKSVVESDGNSHYRLVTVAAIEERKGFDVVLSSLPAVIDQIGPVQYTIVGDGPDRPWLESLIRDSGLQSHVKLVGAVDDVRPYLSDSDVFLLPSSGEGLPNAFLEAMAMGLPSIVSTEPPYDEIARSDFAVSVDRSDPQAMCEAIINLLLDTDRRRSMGIAARKEAEEVYNWPIIAQRYLDVLNETVRSRQSSR